METRVGARDIARYPWIEEAKPVNSQAFFDDLLSDKTLDATIPIAIDRILKALRGEVDYTQFNMLVETRVYVLAICLCKLSEQVRIQQKYALSFGKRMQKFMDEDISEHKRLHMHTFLDLILQLMRRDLGINVEMREIYDQCDACKIKKEALEIQARKVHQTWSIPKQYAVSVPEYLQRVSKFHSENWKLINQVVHGGYVFITQQELVRFVRDAVANMITNRIQNIALPKTLPAKLVERAKELALDYETKHTEFKFVPTAFPPCVREVLNRFSRGENVPHIGRILLASYMSQIGKHADEIAAMFQHAPDYNAETTKYQVNFIVNKGYKVGNCDKYKNADWCFADSQCTNRHIRNPMQYGRPPTQAEENAALEQN